MNSKERVLTAVQHKEPGRVPLFYRDVPEVNVIDDHGTIRIEIARGLDLCK